MTEVFFYHLQHQPLERVLPSLLEKAFERGWRVVVQAGSQERVEALDTHLWTYRDDSFLPHGTARQGNTAHQPIFLTSGTDNPNAATVRFLVEGADLDTFAGYDRIVYIFDGRISDAIQAAREAWRRARDTGCDVTYWQQGQNGRWERKA